MAFWAIIIPLAVYEYFFPFTFGMYVYLMKPIVSVASECSFRQSSSIQISSGLTFFSCFKASSTDLARMYFLTIYILGLLDFTTRLIKQRFALPQDRGGFYNFPIIGCATPK